MAAETFGIEGRPMGPWSKGVNTVKDPAFIDDMELSDAVDVHVNPDGRVGVRSPLHGLHHRPATWETKAVVTGMPRVKSLPDGTAGWLGPRPMVLVCSLKDDGGLFVKAHAVNGLQLTATGQNVENIAIDLPAPSILSRYVNQDLPSPVLAASLGVAFLCWGEHTVIFRTNGSAATEDAPARGGVFYLENTTPRLVSSTVDWTDNVETEVDPQESHAYVDEFRDFTVPIGGDEGWVPRARTMLIWHAGFGEWLLTGRGNRIRWSLPRTADGREGLQNFLEYDYVDLPDTASEITAFARWQDRLLVFTHTSIWMMSGGLPEAWRRVLISRNLGVTDQGSVTETPYGVLFVDSATGSLWVWNGDKPTDLWANRVKVHNPPFHGDGIHHFSCVYHRDRVYVSCDDKAVYGSSPDATVTFVHDLSSNTITKFALNAQYAGVWPATGDISALSRGSGTANSLFVVTRDAAGLYPTAEPDRNQVALLDDARNLDDMSATRKDRLFDNDVLADRSPTGSAVTGKGVNDNPARLMRPKSAVVHAQAAADLAETATVVLDADWVCDGTDYTTPKLAQLPRQDGKWAASEGSTILAHLPAPNIECADMQLRLNLVSPAMTANRVALRWESGLEVNA